MVPGTSSWRRWTRWRRAWSWSETQRPRPLPTATACQRASGPGPVRTVSVKQAVAVSVYITTAGLRPANPADGESRLVGLPPMDAGRRDWRLGPVDERWTSRDADDGTTPCIPCVHLLLLQLGALITSQRTRSSFSHTHTPDPKANAVF